MLLDSPPVPTDQKAGGSNPSERATSPQARGQFYSVGDGPGTPWKAQALTIAKRSCECGPVPSAPAPGHRRWRAGVVRRPDDSLEVVNVGGDSAVGRDRIQSAPNLRRVHAESAQ